MEDPASPTTYTVCEACHAIRSWSDAHLDDLPTLCPDCHRIDWLAAVTDSEWEAGNVHEELDEQEGRFRKTGQ